MMFDSIVVASLNQNVGAQQPPVAAVPVKTEVAKPRKPSQHYGRVPIPEHLERVEILLDIPEEQKVCPETKEPARRWSPTTSPSLAARSGLLIFSKIIRGMSMADAYSGYDEPFAAER